MDHLKFTLTTSQYGDVEIDLAVSISDTEKANILNAIAPLLKDPKPLRLFLGNGKLLLKTPTSNVNILKFELNQCKI